MSVNSFLDLIERPVVTTVLLLLVCAVVGIALFEFAGSVAEVTGQAASLPGITLKFAGPFGGAFVLFYYTNRVVSEQRRGDQQGRLLTEYSLRAPNAGIDPTDDSYKCEFRLYDREGGGWGPWIAVDYTRDGEALVIWVKEMRPGKQLQVQVHDANKNVWRSVRDQPYGKTSIDLRKV